MDDTAVTAGVKLAILNEETLKSLDISVTTEEGVVQLDGKVDSKANSEKAEKLVANVKGVKKVVNNLETD